MVVDGGQVVFEQAGTIVGMIGRRGAKDLGLAHRLVPALLTRPGRPGAGQGEGAIVTKQGATILAVTEGVHPGGTRHLQLDGAAVAVSPVLLSHLGDLLEIRLQVGMVLPSVTNVNQYTFGNHEDGQGTRRAGAGRAHGRL